jgi:hypothetical protein
MTNRKTKIPSKVEAEVMFKSHLQCCVCQEKGDHIHHLDANPSNNSIDNLVLLCFNHHNEATIKGSLSKKLSQQTILKFREHHYHLIENARQKQIEAFDSPVEALTEEKLLSASKNAAIIIEIEKIKEQYFSEGWAQRGDILGQLTKFVNHSNHRLVLEIFEFLSLISTQTRGGMTYRLASSVFETVLDFFPSFKDEEERVQTIELAKICIHLGNNMAYDSFIHLRNVSVAMWGLTIIKFIYRFAKKSGFSDLNDEINQVYDELESTLRRSERTDLGDAQEIVKIFRKDLEEWDLSFPSLPPYLMKRLDLRSFSVFEGKISGMSLSL